MSFFTKVKGFFQLDDSIDKARKLIADYNRQLADKQAIVDEVKAKASAECEGMRLTAKQQADSIIEEAKKRETSIVNEIELLESQRNAQEKIVAELKEQALELEKKHDAESKKYLRLRAAYSSIQYAVKNYDISDAGVPIEYSTEDLDSLLSPTVELHFHSQDLRELRKRANEVRKQIMAVQKTYESRYTTKTAKAMYQFMTLALGAELQNILYNLRYDKLDKNLLLLKSMILKFEKIATEGNQQIAPTIHKFLLQMESLFEQLVKIEYEYYVQQERIKEEQRALREQMRQEAAERRELERQQKQIEKEASKYTTEIESLKIQAEVEQDEAKAEALRVRIEELEGMVSGLNEKRDQIVNLANGKAGYVYVISNLGSFGDNVFKVGMTRRLEPQERVDELSNASVPFAFDVHSFIFSDDAVGLEAALHDELNDKRVKKINLRKEFFRTTVDEIEQLVYQHQPSASFNRTMLAEQYRQTQAVEQNLISFNPDADVTDQDDSDEAEEE